jgi:glycosyltransferase involved in cell wall biosynthesis
MKVVHITASDGTGGADRSAVNLHDSLLQAGVESALLVGKASGGSRGVHEGKQRFLGSRESLEGFLIWSQRTTISNTHFSLNLPGELCLDEGMIRNADVINLHWVAGLISASSLCRLADFGKPIVWTLHDARPLTGGCHFPATCTNYRHSCAECPQLLRDPGGMAGQGRRMLQQALDYSNVHFVAPSTWMREIVESSESGRNREVSTIPYGVDAELFAPIGRVDARQKLGLGREALYILLASHHVAEKRKGFPEAREILGHVGNLDALRASVESGNLRLLLCGHGDDGVEFPGWTVDRVGYLSKDAMPWLYNAADLLLFTSTQDNLPNVVMEAMSCGTAVASHDLPGIRDMFGPGDPAGLLLPMNDARASAMRIGEFLENESARHEAGLHGRRRILDHFGLNMQASCYIRLYESLLEYLPVVPRLGPPVTPEQEIDVIIESLMARSRQVEEELRQTRLPLDSRWARLGRKLGFMP